MSNGAGWRASLVITAIKLVFAPVIKSAQTQLAMKAAQ